MEWSIVFITICGVLGILQGGSITCPAECMCSNTSKGFLADCSSQKLDQVPEGLPENTTILDFSRNVLGGGIPLAKYQLLQLTNLTLLNELRLQFNKIQLIYPDAFPNLTTTRHLLLANNIISIVPTQALTSLPNLQHLDLSNNIITTLHRRAFLNHYLAEVILRDNFILHINADAFDGLPNLISLSLQGNDIANVTNTFRHLSNLQNIDLSHNSLQETSEDIFSQNILLGRINLDNNNISVLSSRTFSNQQNLKKLSLTFNNLNSSALDVLKFLPKLTQLYIYGNVIERLSGNAFVNNPTLLDLDLSSNSLTVIHPETFRGLLHLRTLQLSGNHLQYLPPHVFDYFQDSTVLCLANNPWVCNCSIVYLQESLQRFRTSCEEPQCRDRGSLTSVVAWKPLLECDTGTTISMATAEVTAHGIDTTTRANSSFISVNILIILAIIPAVITLIILILIVICCCCTREREPSSNTADKDTSYNHWKNVMFPTRWSQTSTRLQEGKEKDNNKRISLYDRVKDIVQRPFSTVSLRKNDDYGQRTAGLSMETYLEASNNGPKKTNSYHNTVTGMEPVIESDSEITNEAKIILPKVERGGSPQRDTSGGKISSTQDKKDEKSEERQETHPQRELPDCNITTIADVNISMSLHNSDNSLIQRIKGGVKDMPLPPVPGDDTYEIPQDEQQRLPAESKTAAHPKEEGVKHFSATPTNKGTQHCDEREIGQRPGISHPPNTHDDQADLDFDKGYINREVVNKHRLTSQPR